ncbi:MAG TPA: DinB family protein [Blastocatellia bacterium]|jgi:uncharacterized damage-inducible protein DinB|nr:DinB family protein [Blastocatellia bacterium]
METTKALGDVALEGLRTKITKVLPSQVRSCVEQLSEEQLWWRPNEQANSVGNLVLHISGSMRHFLSHLVGGIEYVRDRDAEFAERNPVAKDQLLAIFDETIRQAAEVLNSFETSRFLHQTEQPGYHNTVFDRILGVALHLATHMGQIVYVTKMLQEGSVDELWIRAQKA